MTEDREPLNIIITGVGGQGNVLASRLVATAAVAAGLRIAVGETFGVSQRGGSVMSHVRISREKQYGPLIPRGHARVVVGLEPLETLRLLAAYANSATLVIMNDRPNYPLGCLTGADRYPDIELMKSITERIVGRLVSIPASGLAAEAGSLLSTNTVMTGALVGSGILPFGSDYFLASIEKLFSGETGEINKKAFLAGFAQTGGGGVTGA